MTQSKNRSRSISSSSTSSSSSDSPHFHHHKNPQNHGNHHKIYPNKNSSISRIPKSQRHYSKDSDHQTMTTTSQGSSKCDLHRKVVFSKHCSPDDNNKGSSSSQLPSSITYGGPVLLAVLLYINTLNAGFVYDDHRGVLGNQDVIGSSVPLWKVFQHDFWGSDLSRKGSHGSWRPITTLSFRWNVMIASYLTPQQYPINSVPGNMGVGKGNSDALIEMIRNAESSSSSSPSSPSSSSSSPSSSSPSSTSSSSSSSQKPESSSFGESSTYDPSSVPSSVKTKTPSSSSLNSSISASTFHLVNVLLHAAVTASYVGVLEYVGVSSWVCLGSGALFASHPVHVEAVAGIVGRAELMAALAFCLALTTYMKYLGGRHEPIRASSTRSIANSSCRQGYSARVMNIYSHSCCVYWDEEHQRESKKSTFDLNHSFEKKDKGLWLIEVPSWGWLLISIGCTGVAMACKEQGITALGVALSLHTALIINNRYTKYKSLLKHLTKELWSGLLGISILLWIRLSISSHRPSFTNADNPIAHATCMLTRALSIGRSWAIHARLIVWPSTLSFDWSMGSVPLVTSIWDPTNIETVVLIAIITVLTLGVTRECWRNRQKWPNNTRISKSYHNIHDDAYHDMLNNNRILKEEVVSKTKSNEQRKLNILSHTSSWDKHQSHLVLALALMIIPFLPASNLAAYVGFVVAERVLYLPSMGTCLLIALGSQKLWHLVSCDTHHSTRDEHEGSIGSFRRTNLKQRWIMMSWVLLLTLFSAKTITRNFDWYSDESLYLSGVKLNPPKALANLGVVYSEQGRLQEAEDAYRSALLHAPNMADTHYNLGLLLASKGLPEAAIRSYQSAIHFRPWLAQAYLAMGAALQQINKHQQAIKVFEKCGKISPSSPARDSWSQESAITTCRLRLAKSRILSGDSHVALKDLSQALMDAPEGFADSHAIYTLMGEAHLERGEHLEAQQMISKALLKHPQNVLAHLTFSKMLLKANGSRVSEAEQWIRRAMALAPNDPHPHKHLAQLLVDEGRLDEGVDAWLKVVLLDPEDPTAAFNAASALRLNGNNKMAETFYKRAVQLQPMDLASQRNLGAILHLNGKLGEARRHYEKALAISPGDPQTTINLQRLESLFKMKGNS